MPKRGLDVSSCETFHFYKLITTKSLIKPGSMTVCRQSESYQEDIYPPTASAQPSLTAQEWLSGMNKGEEGREKAQVNVGDTGVSSGPKWLRGSG